MKTPAQKIRNDIHKNAHRMDMQELLELSDKLTQCIDMKLRMREPVRSGDIEALEKYASEPAFSNFARQVVSTFK